MKSKLSEVIAKILEDKKIVVAEENKEKFEGIVADYEEKIDDEFYDLMNKTLLDIVYPLKRDAGVDIDDSYSKDKMIKGVKENLAKN